MFTAVVRARNEPMALAATLGPLVRGVVQGLVGSAILVAPTASEDIAEISDAAGCRLLIEPDWAEGFARAVSLSAGRPLIIIDSGSVIGEGFWEALADQTPLIGDRPAVTRPAAGVGTLARFARLLPGLAPKLGPERALLVPGSRAREIARARLDPWQAVTLGEAVELDVPVRRIPAGR
jgi:hypothetical protein